MFKPYKIFVTDRNFHWILIYLFILYVSVAHSYRDQKPTWRSQSSSTRGPQHRTKGQAWIQTPLPTEPFRQHKKDIYFIVFTKHVGNFK